MTINEELKRINAKIELKLPLSEREQAYLLLFGKSAIEVSDE